MELTPELLLDLISAAPDSLLVVDQDGRIVFANDQTEQVFGWTADELVGRTVEDLVPQEVATLHIGHRAGYLHNPRPRPMGAGLQLTARRKDGTMCPVDISLNAVAEGLVVVAVRDVTERIELENERRRRALEAQRQQSHRLESLGQLAGGVAHDFNNLLGVILNYVSLLERAVADADPQLVGDVGEIRSAAERGSALTRQLLAFARRDVDQAEAFDVAGALRDVCRMLERTLPADIEITCDVGEAPLIAVAAPHAFEQVMLNLAINARDAMPEGGQLRVTARPVATSDGDQRVDAHVDAQADIEIRVSDTGVGMTPEVRGRALEPFFTTKPRGRGTGLGLSTVYGLVRAHGGDVEIDSVAGAGTTVAIQLRGGTLGDVARQPQQPDDLRGCELVLLVEDEPALRESTRRILAEAGYEVLLAADGREALAIVEESPVGIDLVVTDVVMPRMGGHELAAELATSHPHLPVVTMTGHDAAGRTPHVHLAKPFSTDELLRTVRRELDD